jgi:hypothetical protein
MKISSKTLAALTFFAGVIAAQDLTAQTCRPALPYYCDRTCWAARAPQCTITTMSALNRAVIHHTAATSDYDTTGEADTKPKIRAIQNYHMDVNGWCDIGYHFLVNKQGNIFSGRRDSGTISMIVRGAHDACNTDSFGFNLMGNYEVNAVTAAGKDALAKIIACRMPSGWNPTGTGTTYCNGVTDKVIGHRQVYATACPGANLWSIVQEGAGFENLIAAKRPCP